MLPNAGDEGWEGNPREHIRSLSRSVLLPRVANVTQTRGHGMPQEPQIEPQRSPRSSPRSTTSRPWGPLGPNGDDDGREGTPRRPQIAIPSIGVARSSSERYQHGAEIIICIRIPTHKLPSARSVSRV